MTFRGQREHRFSVSKKILSQDPREPRSDRSQRTGKYEKPLLQRTYVDDELRVDCAGVNTNSSKACQQLHRDPAVNVHLTAKEKVLY